jgi:hypothetical protein
MPAVEPRQQSKLDHDIEHPLRWVLPLETDHPIPSEALIESAISSATSFLTSKYGASTAIVSITADAHRVCAGDGLGVMLPEHDNLGCCIIQMKTVRCPANYEAFYAGRQTPTSDRARVDVSNYVLHRNVPFLIKVVDGEFACFIYNVFIRRVFPRRASALMPALDAIVE